MKLHDRHRGTQEDVEIQTASSPGAYVMNLPMYALLKHVNWKKSMTVDSLIVFGSGTF